MTPKFIILTRKTDDSLVDKSVYVNPRRVNAFHRLRPPTQHPGLFVGTIVDFGRSETILVCETPDQIERLLTETKRKPKEK